MKSLLIALALAASTSALAADSAYTQCMAQRSTNGMMNTPAQCAQFQSAGQQEVNRQNERNLEASKNLTPYRQPGTIR